MSTICIVVIIIIIFLIVKFGSSAKEHMTRIRRTVGNVNTGDEIPTAAGVISSMPIMDMTHTYHTGDEKISCDECPNKESCPRCPQYGAVDNVEFMTDASGADAVDNIRPEYIDGEPTVIDCVQYYDLESDFTSSREFMGAQSGKQRSTSRVFDRDNALDADYDQFDRAVTLGRKASRPADGSALKILYADTMGLSNPEPSDVNCEFMNEIGYIYKEECN